jgi:hypothetical protein
MGGVVTLVVWGAVSVPCRPGPPPWEWGPTLCGSGVSVEDVDLSTVESPAAAARAQASADKQARIRELAEWDQLDRTQRRQLGLPVSDTEWAKVKGLNARRVAKYRAEPFYDKCVADLRNITKKRLAPGGAASLADLPFSAGSAGIDDVSDYAAIKTQVASMARQGEQRALDLWLKHWGKPFLDEEIAGRVTDLASLSDEEVVVQVVEVVSPVLLAEVLRGRGWVVDAPRNEGLPRMLAEDAS